MSSLPNHRQIHTLLTGDGSELPHRPDRLTDAIVTVLTAGCELKGQAQIVSRGAPDLDLDLWRESGAEWCVLVRVEPAQVQIRSEQGWGNLETVDL